MALAVAGKQEGRLEVSEDEILTLRDVAERLKTSVKSVRRRIRDGHLRAFKEGGRVLVLKSDLDDYLRRQIEATATR
ncbi:excisionase family DNA-binding protein [Haloferula helveola]|uniref:Excisionase family DNA-binding protein n=1 Tax=Haloferula helveola TaxID=490095 RepID=A0ABM7REN2_9BACT|nr:excisionase family DNA-binding protein [Haloferula helveola]